MTSVRPPLGRVLRTVRERDGSPSHANDENVQPFVAAEPEPMIRAAAFESELQILPEALDRLG